MARVERGIVTDGDALSAERGPVVFGPERPRPVIRLAVIAAIALLCAGFVALGVWQVERRAWKLALIERIEERVHADPTDPPDRSKWTSVNAADDEYRHVRLAGRFLHDRTTLVRALTDYGSGYWAIVPLRLEDGDVVLVNRGFVASADAVATAPAASAEATVVTGLLRMTEPRGTRLQDNEPIADRWYSRDVDAIARARGLQRVAPYFVDADADTAAGTGAAAGARSSGNGPIGGLTVIAFRNDHLSYAITWFVLAGLCGVAIRRVLRTAA